MLKTLRIALAFASLTVSGNAIAQGPALFSGSVDLTAGNIVAPHLLHGDMWWNPATGTSQMQFPKGASNRLSGVSSIWMAGMDAQSNLVGAMQKYRNVGSDFWPGPLGTALSDAANNQQTADWAKIWRIDRGLVELFVKMNSHTLANTPEDILEWPGKGNSYARGRNGAIITVANEMAPFVDLNRNGIYEPLAGEYPDVKGDQMLWWVINDNCQHPHSRTGAMKLELRITAYSFVNGPNRNNILFYEYDMRHEYGNTINDFVFAPMVDLDLGYAFDDYAGYDSARRVAVMYDKTAAIAGTQVAAGYVLLQQPGDSFASYSPAGAMNFVRNAAPNADSDPDNALEGFRIMTGYDRLGTKRVANSNYAISSLKAQCDANAPGGDLRVIVATQPVRFPPQQNLHFAYALVAADSVQSCPNIDFRTLTETVDTAFSVYYHPSRITSGNPNGVGSQTVQSLRIYPNPAQSSVTVSGITNRGTAIRVTNILGATVYAPAQWAGNEFRLDVAALPAGMYYVSVQDGASHRGGSFIRN